MAEDFEIEYEAREGYLFAQVSGPKDSVDVSKRFWDAIIARMNEIGEDRVLVVEDFPNQLSPADMYAIAVIVSKLFRQPKKLALVDTCASHYELNAFGETVATNRGAAARAFNDMDDAIAWLRS